MVMTGKLGDVMQESVQAALTYIRARAEQFGLPKNFYKRNGYSCPCAGRGDSQRWTFCRNCHGNIYCFRPDEEEK